jgi:Protein of unknown function (DUF4238)
MRKSIEEKQFRVEVPTELHIGWEMKTIDVVLKTLFRRKWIVLLAPTASAGFITCDHPVCLMFSDPSQRGKFYGPGHGLTGTEVFFPIGKRMVIVGAFEFNGATRELSEDGVAMVNGAMVTYAYRQTYAYDESASYTRGPTERPRPVSSLIKDPRFLRDRQTRKSSAKLAKVEIGE